MKKLALTAAALLASVALGLPAVANAEWYAGAAYTHYDLDDAEVGGVTGRLGYNFHPNIGVEGEATFGVEDDDNAELDNAYGVYAVGRLPVGQSFDVFGRVGYQQLEVDGSGPIADISDQGVGYGVGANWKLSNGFAVRGDFTRLEGDDADADTFSLGGTFSF